MMVSGILPLYKPAGMTSHDCVMRIRKLLHTKKVGHSGTLDPQVTGVLPLCIGNATKVADYLHEQPKKYIATMVLGQATDTEDGTGNVIATQPVNSPITKEKIQEVFSAFTGEISQMPPMYSAVKVGGIRLHEAARKGMAIEREARKVRIYELELIDGNLTGEYPSFTFQVTCSKGTYIRTLCKDMGEAFGYPAHMSYLQRIKSGPFSLDDCYTFAEIEKAIDEDKISSLLYPLDRAFTHYPAVAIPAGRVRAIRNGLSQIHLQPGNWEEGQKIAIYSPEGKFLAIHQVQHTEKGVESFPVRVFPEEEG
jgi:tRNA pseudouridine55 synthase